MSPLIIQLIEAVRLVNAMKVDYAVLGGLAVNLYGEPRFTADVDMNIMLEKEKLQAFIQKARKFGFSPACANLTMFIKKTGVIPMNFSKRGVRGRCDFIIAENELEKAALGRAVIRKTGSIKAKFVSPEDLIVHKIISLRPHDREDVRGILIRQFGKLDMRYIKNWLAKLDKMDKNLNSLALLNRLTKRPFKT
ncbi:MAG: nucleotidyltransferase [Candidatus Omnitrophica bacterium]|nr:nucleotidyltransferase [Candidatus Omnitrophota bacterium]